LKKLRCLNSGEKASIERLDLLALKCSIKLYSFNLNYKEGNLV
jgi:hypothetical protein